MNKKLNSENQSQLLPFVPRSVLMALESQSTKTKEKKEKKKNSKKGEKSLDGSREVLLKSIAGFLEINGFKKTLDMFLSEAQIEENSWKSSAANLDDIFSKNFESSNGNEAASIECEKTQDTEKETLNVEKSTPVVEKSEEKESKKERKEKKKKKKSNEKASDENPDADVEKSTPVEEKTEEITEEKNDKKKSKKQKDEINNNEEELKASNNENKDGKKNKKKEKETNEINQENEQQNGENGDRKVSKKRKKPDSEENKEEENMGNDTNAPEMENGNEELKSGKKDKASAEPKTAIAFKRVKIEEVKFADQRLQDNSYWAKSGADSGYGAKAQQILEQVRGRDFRHEKTKKKRGSYRGGQIDLQSHSIKFNYSDEE